MPVERSENFKNSTLRLAARSAPSACAWSLVVAVGRRQRVPATCSGPKILGSATNIIVAGLQSQARHRLHPAAQHAAGRARPLRRAPPCCRTCRPTCWPASCSARCSGCGPTSRTSSTACPLRYVDRQPRGDLLSRVTNDIDNVAQSLQQTLSQMLTSMLTIVGVLIMMFTISPLLALIALVTIPVSMLHHHVHRPAVQGALRRPVDPHRHPERAGRGGLHRPLAGQGVRPPARRRGEVQREERRALRRQLRRPVHLRHDPAGDDVPRQPELRGHRGRRRPAGGVGPAEHRRHPGVHPVLAPVHPAAHPAGVDGQRAAVGHRLGRAGLRAARRRGAEPGRPGAPGRRPAARAGSSSTTCGSPTTRRTRSSRTCRWSPSRARRSPSSVRPVRARPRWST